MNESTSPKLSVALCIQNEEEQLADCLATLGFVDEIVVVLDRCSDKSKEIAESFGAKIVEGQWPIEGARRHVGIDRCTGDWILEIDADERVSEALGREIREKISSATPGYFLIPFDNYIGDRRVRHGWGGSWGVMAAPRLFTPGAKQWGERRIHPPLILRGSQRWLKTPIKHYVDRDFRDMVFRLQLYSDQHAADLRASGEKLPPIWWTLRRCVSRFLKCYFVRKGYREGRWGFAIAMMAALYPLLSHLKAELDDD